LATELVIFGVIVLAIVFGGIWVYRGDPVRDTVLYRAACLSASLAIGSITLAILLETVWCQYKPHWGLPLIGAWVAVPPIWFFFEYYLWPPSADKDERTRHFHDLSRNLWLALVVILAAIMEIKFPGSSD
jgi:hypothetical protein